MSGAHEERGGVVAVTERSLGERRNELGDARSLLAASATVALAAPRLLANFAGKWAVTVVGPDGSTQPSVMTITQKADSVSGTIQTQLGVTTMAGVAKGDSLLFKFQFDLNGQALVINGAGVLKGKDNVNGTLNVSGMGAMAFSAVRQK